jgi:hypothetical protein
MNYGRVTCGNVHVDLLLQEVIAKHEERLQENGFKVMIPTQNPTEENLVDTAPAEPSSKKVYNRCDFCRKRVGLAAIQCRCGGTFCAIHRYSTEHNCTFDYHAMGADEIRRNNPVVQGSKLADI